MKKYLKEGCPFCRVEIQETTFLESKSFRAIYNHAPILPGHSLIIPKFHAESLLELSENDVCEMVNLSRQAIKTLQSAFGIEGFNWTIQEKPEAGQTIPHLHLHIIPRQSNDLPRPGDWYPLLLKSEIIGEIDSDRRKKIKNEELIKIATHLKEISSKL